MAVRRMPQDAVGCCFQAAGAPGKLFGSTLDVVVLSSGGYWDPKLIPRSNWEINKELR